MDQVTLALSPTMCRDARVLLRLSPEEPAGLAGISVSTVSRLERGEPVGDYPRAQILAALEAEGLMFVKIDKGSDRNRRQVNGRFAPSYLSFERLAS